MQYYACKLHVDTENFHILPVYKIFSLHPKSSPFPSLAQETLSAFPLVLTHLTVLAFHCMPVLPLSSTNPKPFLNSRPHASIPALPRTDATHTLNLSLIITSLLILLCLPSGYLGFGFFHSNPQATQKTKKRNIYEVCGASLPILSGREEQEKLLPFAGCLHVFLAHHISIALLFLPPASITQNCFPDFFANQKTDFFC